jgi:uncharacterized DUF497 family protein
MRYEWDERKNRENQRKHDGISFELAALVFEDRDCLIELDRVDEAGEQRWHALGAVRRSGSAGGACVQNPRGGERWRRDNPHPQRTPGW